MRTIDHTKNIVEVKNVSFAYGDTEVLKDVSLNIHKGDYLAIIGPNGGGKTTLLKIMLGLLKPTQGTVNLFGQNIRDFKHWPKIGYVPQKVVRFDSQFPATVDEVVSMGLYGQKGFFKSLNNQDRVRVIESLKKVEMLEYKDKLIGNLSGGQQQRVFIARTLVSQPEILFLDEPTVGVDLKTQEDFYHLLHTLNETLDLTLVLVTHELDIVAHQATEVACINQNLIYHGSPKELMKSENLEKLYSRELNFFIHH
jgi:zinc transport system ATP-binding protein